MKRRGLWQLLGTLSAGWLLGLGACESDAGSGGPPTDGGSPTNAGQGSQQGGQAGDTIQGGTASAVAGSSSATGGAGESGSGGTRSAAGMAGSEPADAGGPHALGGDGSGGQGGAATGATCVERGTACNSYQDCKTGQTCVNQTCQAGKPIGADCSPNEVCGRYVECGQSGKCVATRVLQYGDACWVQPPAEDPILDCALEPDLFCFNWGPGLVCGKPGSAEGSHCPCASHFYCADSDGPTRHCSARGTNHAACSYLSPDSCEDGLACRHDGATSSYTCLAPGEVGDYCDPVDHSEELGGAPMYAAWRTWPAQCGPNLFCDDDAADDVNAEPLGRCQASPQATSQLCGNDQDCDPGNRCREFYSGFAKTCGKLAQAGDQCSPDQRFPCDEGLECLFRQPRSSDLESAVCLRPVALGGSCDLHSLCAEDGACVAP